MNEMRKLMETVTPLFEWDDADEFDFDSAQDFMDYLGEQGARKYDLEVEDQYTTVHGDEITLFNGESMVTGTVSISDSLDFEDGGVTLETYRAAEGIPLDSHYFERMDKATADQIIDLMGMPLENTIGRRPY